MDGVRHTRLRRACPRAVETWHAVGDQAHDQRQPPLPCGDVAAFLRAFAAAGCGSLSVTLWSVLDDQMVHVAGTVRWAVREAPLRTVAARPCPPPDLPLRAAHELVPPRALRHEAGRVQLLVGEDQAEAVADLVEG